MKKAYYKEIPNGLLLLNWIVQRIFRHNCAAPFSVHFTSKINGPHNMTLSESAMLSLAVSNGLFIKAFDGSKLSIGQGTILANNVTIHTGNHGLIDRNTHELKDIVIGDNCWLASGVTIVGGVTLGDNVTVGANSVVTKSFPNNVVIAGVPAKIIKQVDSARAQVK